MVLVHSCTEKYHFALVGSNKSIEFLAKYTRDSSYHLMHAEKSSYDISSYACASLLHTYA